MLGVCTKLSLHAFEFPPKGPGSVSELTACFLIPGPVTMKLSLTVLCLLGAFALTKAFFFRGGGYPFFGGGGGGGYPFFGGGGGGGGGLFLGGGGFLGGGIGGNTGFRNLLIINRGWGGGGWGRRWGGGGGDDDDGGD